MLRYCKLDTLAMVKIHEVFEKIVKRNLIGFIPGGPGSCKSPPDPPFPVAKI
jgi:hypothetical protein